jgi:hypothetical protein
VQARLSAAALVVAIVPFVAGGCARAPVAHTCSATDKQFIGITQVDMDSLGYWSESLASGDAGPAQVISQTKIAERSVTATAPTDPTLVQTRLILRAMLSEYWRAVAARQHHREAGVHMMRAYGLANFAHDALVQAQPALMSKGCDVSPLL